MLNSDIIEGKWHEIKGKVKAQWGKITDDELQKMSGNREEILGVLQKHYGYKTEEAKKELERFLEKLH